jgi:hypothetical protein
VLLLWVRPQGFDSERHDAVLFEDIPRERAGKSIVGDGQSEYPRHMCGWIFYAKPGSLILQTAIKLAAYTFERNAAILQSASAQTLPQNQSLSLFSLSSDVLTEAFFGGQKGVAIPRTLVVSQEAVTSNVTRVSRGAWTRVCLLSGRCMTSLRVEVWLEVA